MSFPFNIAVSSTQTARHQRGNPPRCIGAPPSLNLMKQETEQDGATAQVSKSLCAIVLKQHLVQNSVPTKVKIPWLLTIKNKVEILPPHNQLRTCTVTWCSDYTRPGVVGQSFHQLTVYNLELGIFTALLIVGS